LQEPENRDNENPFFNSWVTKADIEALLDISDIERNDSAALFNDTEQRETAIEVVNYRGGAVPAGMRDWLANPYELRLTHTNLMGVPFAFSLRAEATANEKFALHADQLAFSVESPCSRERQEDSPDCVPLRMANQNASDPNWLALTVAGLATGAVPIIFMPRTSNGRPTPIFGAIPISTRYKKRPSSSGQLGWKGRRPIPLPTPRWTARCSTTSRSR
jgi:hypothetical protein